MKWLLERPGKAEPRVDGVFSWNAVLLPGMEENQRGEVVKEEEEQKRCDRDDESEDGNDESGESKKINIQIPLIFLFSL